MWINTGTHLKFDCGCQFPLTNDPYLENLERPAVDVDLDSIPVNCWRAWHLIGTGRTKGVFQLESRLGQKWAKSLKPESLEHLGALGSILRPGSLHSLDEEGISVTQHYCNRKNGAESVTYDHPSLEPLLHKTYGLNIFQENSMQLAQLLASFTLQEADTLRKCVTGDTMFVSKSRGWITIDRLLEEGYANDQFLVMDELGQQSWQEIEKIWFTGNKDVNKVESSTGFSVKATRYHQFLTNNGWKARMRLKEDDSLVCAKYVEYDGEDKISPELAMIISGLVCEGYFTKDANDGRVARLLNEQKKYVNRYMEYGLSDTKKLPDIMLGMTKETTRKFLSFILGCEGGVTKLTGHFEFSSKSKKFADQVKLLLLRFGIRSFISEKKDPIYGIFYRLYINDQVDQKRLIKENLDEFWPLYKREDFRARFSNGKDVKANFTTDSIPNNIMLSMIDQYPNVMGVGMCGRWYKENISRPVFQRIASKSNDSNWINLANGNQTYEKLKSKDEWFKQRKTYDFTIKGGKTPYIIANGIVIHNSIGKKDASLMAKVRKMFLDKAKETALVSDDIASKIFTNIQESQRYSFNRCISPETIVETSTGMKTLADLEVGEKVNSPYGFIDVIDKIDNGAQEVYEVTVESGKSVVCTIDHKFLCEDDKVRPLWEILEKGYRVMCED